MKIKFKSFLYILGVICFAIVLNSCNSDDDTDSDPDLQEEEDDNTDGSTTGGDSTTSGDTTSGSSTTSGSDTTDTSTSGGQDDITTTYKVEKSVILENYNSQYLASAVSDPGWTGNVANCDAGSAPQSTHDKVIMRINYFRQLVGLNNNTTLDESKFDMYQEAALILSANEQLSHEPPNTWLCWTQAAYDGTKTSNISIGFPAGPQAPHASNAVTGFIEDPGANNVDVGHRRWILHSKKTEFSYGTTNNTMSLGVIGFEDGNTEVPSFIAYPAEGYMPRDLVFERWSFGIPDADFANAQVEMKDSEGNSINLKIESRDKTYADKTIVWVPEGIVTDSDNDVTYTITVSDISSAASSTYTYGVTIIKP